MTTSAWWLSALHVALVILAVVMETTAYSYSLEQKVKELGNELRDELQELSEKVEDMSDRVEKMSKFTDKVEKSFFALSGGGKLEADVEEEKEVVLPVTIHELRRKPLENGLTHYSVRFVKNVDDVFYRCYDYETGSYIVPEISTVKGALEEVSVTVNDTGKGVWDNDSGLWFTIYNTNMVSRLSLTLGKPSLHETDGSKGDVPTLISADELGDLLPTVKLDPPKELVYDEGYDSEIKVFLAGRHKKSGPRNFPPVDTKFYFYDLDDKEFLTVHKYLENITEFNGGESVKGGTEYTIKLRTSQRNVCGLAELSFLGFRTNSFLKYVGTTSLLQIRPSTQKRAFLEGVIAFPEYEYNVHGKCPIRKGVFCPVQCTVAGGDIFGVTIQQVMPDGSLEPLKTNYSFESPYMKTVTYNSPLPPLTEVSEPKKYLCSATSFKGTTIKKEINVTFTMQPEIVEESFDLAEDGTLKTVELQCTARGLPLPNVVFHLILGNELLNNQQPDRTEISDYGLEVKAFKTVSWNLEESSDPVTVELHRAYCFLDSINTYSDFKEVYASDLSDEGILNLTPLG